jgi:GAF domain-containing protein
MAGKSHSSQGTAAARAVASESSVEFVLAKATSPEKFCEALAKLFGVRAKEVALLRLEKGLLKFLFPEQLKTAGSIPVSSSSSIASHTASTKKTELFNTFAKVKHARVFETVKLNVTEEVDHSEHSSIQKLMSAPVLSPERKVLGVIQVCRKGFELASAGPDFTLDDLQQLEIAAKVAAELPFLTDAAQS